MDKLARKRSPDPKQEALREKKDQWNTHTSDLIDDLIALKRGINGRGDKDKNLPPSSIRESFPPQIGAYLQDVANSAARVIQEAKTIVQQQQEYSQTRRRRKKSAHQERELIKLAELISEASWWGSRMYSRYFALRNMPVIQRNQVVDMMYALADIKDKLKVFEDNLLKSNKEGIAISFTNLNSLIHDYSSNVLKPAKKLQKILFEEPESEDFKRDLEQRHSPSSAPSITSEREARMREKQLQDEEAKKIADTLSEDYEFLEHLMGYILPPDGFFIMMTGGQRSQLEKKFNDYERFHIIFTTPTKDRYTSKKSKIDLDNWSRLHSEIVGLILSLLFKADYKDGKLVNLKYPKGGVPLNMLFTESDKDPIIDDITFQNIFKKLPVAEMNRILRSESGSSESSGSEPDDSDSNDLNIEDYKIDNLEKNAGIKSEIRAKVLGIFPDSFNISQINSYKISKKCKEEINKILNMLEEPSTTIPNILKKLNDLSAFFKELSENVLDLGKSYKLYLRRTTKSKDSYLSDIKSEDLYSLKDAANQLSISLKTTPDVSPKQFRDPTE